MKIFVIIVINIIFLIYNNAFAQSKNLYWGDTHTHSSYSFDAFLSKNISVDPDKAYKFAKGQPILHPLHRARVQLKRPLDFLVVADHAEGLGIMETLYYNREGFVEGKDVSTLRSAIDNDDATSFFKRILPQIFPSGNFGEVDPVELGDLKAVTEHAWHKIADAADRHYQPGIFTTFIGWEWSAYEQGGNLHRVVFSPMNAIQAKSFLPFGADKSNNPKDLWQFLNGLYEDKGFDFISIPHNSNVSKNYMFPESISGSKTEVKNYSKLRQRWEPVVEITQFKGDSETHPALSPNDEFADFSPFPFYISEVHPEPYVAKKGEYVRSALLSGLAIHNKVGSNPYQFGVIGSTDSHTGLSTAEETEFAGKMAMDGIPESKEVMFSEDSFNGWDMSAAGMAAVWAENNDRESLFNAFQRREVYATTGPRISLRVFAGWDFTVNDLKDDDLSELGYSKGVPMGAVIRGDNIKKPLSLLITTDKDPLNANLDRVQVIKGWLDKEGNKHEKIFNVAWAGERTLDPKGKIMAIGNTVDMNTGKVENIIGAESFKTVWHDPEFNVKADAFYYIRVLQIPTIHHSYLDALALGKKEIEGQPKTIQERAYSSPIWYYGNK